MTTPTIPTPAPTPAAAPAKKPAKKRGDKKRTKKAKVASKAKRAAKKASGNGKPAVQGDEMKSRMVCLDAGFADYLASEAKKLTRSTGEHHSVTDVSRLLLKRLAK